MFRKIAANQDAIDSLVQTLRTIADPTRLRLLGVLQGGERNVTSLCEELDLPQPTVIHHLGLLRHASIVVNRRAGKQVFYSLNEKNVSNIGDHGGVKLATDDLEVQILQQADPNQTPQDDVQRAATMSTAIHADGPVSNDVHANGAGRELVADRTLEQKPV